MKSPSPGNWGNKSQDTGQITTYCRHFIATRQLNQVLMVSQIEITNAEINKTPRCSRLVKNLTLKYIF